MIYKLRTARRGGHVEVKVFAGTQEGSLGLCGVLMFRAEEARPFIRSLQQSRDEGLDWVIVEGDVL